MRTQADPNASPDWLIENIAECSKNARAIYLLYLGFLAYCAVTLFGITDRQIVLNEGVRLPIVNVDVSLGGFGFFLIAPVVAFALFAYLQLYLQRLRQLKLDLHEGYPDVDARRLYPWMLNITDHPELGFLGFLQKLVVGLLLWGTLPAVLLAFAVVFLKTHAPVATWVWSLVPALGALTVAYFWYVYGGGISQHWDAAPPYFLFMTGLAAAICLLAARSHSLAGDHDKGRTLDLSFQILIEEQNAEYDVFWVDLREAQLQGADLTSAVLKKADLKEAVLDRATLSGANLREARLDGASLIDADFSDVRLDSASLRKVWLDGADFTRAWLSNADLFEARVEFERAILYGAQLDDADVRLAQLGGVDLRDASLIRTDFRNARLNGADLRGANVYRTQLDGAWLNGADLSGVEFNKADLRHARLIGADLQHAVFDSIRLYEARLDGAKLGHAEFLDSTNLSRAWLTRASLEQTHLNGADLSSARLYGANLTETKLNGANLEGARFNGAYLAGTYLEGGAFLSSAELDGAYLYKTRLTGAHLHHAQLDSALLIDVQLRNATLYNADLRGAVIIATEVDSADLQGADFSGVSFLDVPNPRYALTDLYASLPDSVRGRIRTNIPASNRRLRAKFPELPPSEVVKLLCQARKLGGIKPDTLRRQLRDECSPEKFEESEPY